MNLFDLIILNVVLLTFPIMLWLFYMLYNKNIGKEELDLLLDFSLITSLYLIIRFGPGNPSINLLLLINIPLIIAYFKGRKGCALLLSVMIVVYSYSHFESSHLLLLLEYGLYYWCYLLLRNSEGKGIYVISLLKIINYLIFVITFNYFGSFNIYVVLNLAVIILETIFITLLVISLYHKINDIIKYHMSLKELEQEKQFRETLFRITHEIKNPIAVCKGYLDMFDINDSKHSKKYIPILKEEIERTLILLQDFLCMTNIKMELERINLVMVLEDVLDNFIPVFKNKKIQYEFDFEKEDVYIYGDYNRMTQVFINIIKNAVEAVNNKENKKITIKTESINKVIKISIIDNGIGFSKEQLKKLGEPFYTTKLNGTGLGVSLSQEIIKGHKGNLEYISDLNKETKVIITLPLLVNN